MSEHKRSLGTAQHAAEKTRNWICGKMYKDAPEIQQLAESAWCSKFEIDLEILELGKAEELPK